MMDQIEEHLTEKKVTGSKTGTALRQHLTDATAIIAESTPLFAGFETFVAGMANPVSLNARLLAVGLAFGGLGYVYGKGRDLTRKTFKITDKSKESVQQFCDAGYALAFNVLLSPPVYLISGSRNFKEIALGTACAGVMGLINGGPIGYVIDTFRDMSGLKKSERIPNWIKDKSPAVKKGLAALTLALSLGLTAGVYKAHDYLAHQNQGIHISQQAQTTNSASYSLENRL